MLFNSIDFLFFVSLIFTVYWIIGGKRNRAQNLLILLASYTFYGWWDWRFLSLIFISSLSDFFLGKQIYRLKDPTKRRAILYISLLINLGSLAFFKYFNFFIESFVNISSSIGFQANISTLNIILPVGISFYTFQTMSYTIDIYYNKLKPTSQWIDFFAFVSFFPQLVAGPIERASSLLPQFSTQRKFSYDFASKGMRQILGGLVKKILIADNLAVFVNEIYAMDATTTDGSLLLLGTIAFAFQIYCDFAGYSDIAIGVARLFGFNLMKNFSFPYFSTSISEFWKNWHISLSTWFRDYVYIPLGGNRLGNLKQLRNSIVTFTISGLWHGASVNFIIWGFLNGIFYLPSIFLKSNKIKNPYPIIQSIRNLTKGISTFLLICLTWVFFRSTDITQALEICKQIFSISILYFPGDKWILIWYFILPFTLWEWFLRKKEHSYDLKGFSTITRWIIYVISCIAIMYFSFIEEKTPQEFIYFQF